MVEHDPRDNGRPVHRVLLVDDHPMIRRAIARVIAQEQDLDVCGEASDAMAAMELARRKQPDVVILDLRLKAGHGLEMLGQLCTQNPEAACLVYSMLDERVYGARAIRAGAMGFLNKRASASLILEAVRTILKGHIYVSPTVASRMLRGRPDDDEADDTASVERLSDRELAVFELLGEGKSIAQIADQLAISPKTAASFRQRIRSHLNVASNEELVRLAIEWLNGV